MKRRITLFLTTLGLLLIGFSLYWLIADTPDNPVTDKFDHFGAGDDGSVSRYSAKTVKTC